MGKFLKAAEEGGLQNHLSYHTMLMLLLHSIALGTVLVIATFFELKYLGEYTQKIADDGDEEEDDAGDNGQADGSPARMLKKKSGKPVDTLELFLGSANLLFLSVGLTGIMLLVNNNLVRAFAIIAALALIRFRIKLDQKSLNASLLFAILGGMACGLDEAPLAWTATGLYIVLFVVLLIVVRLLKPRPA